MLRAVSVALVATVVPFLHAPAAAAESCDLTLDRVLALAHERAPAIVAARSRVDEARARLDGASLLLRENPELEGDAGPRLSSQGDSTDVRARLSQALELGGARGARIAGASAGVAQAAADADDALLRVRQAAAAAFLRTRAAVEQLALAESTADMASELLQAAERRHRAGDVPELDVDLAHAARSRARADVAAARATRRASAGRLAQLLALGDAEPSPCGPLAAHAKLDLDELLRHAPERADLRALAASVDEAEADGRLAAARAWPAVRVGTEYKREQGDDVYLGGLSISVPLFERGQSARAEAEARARRLRAEHEASVQAASSEVRTAWDVYRERRGAVAELARELPTLDDSDRLARRSYEAGELSLADMLQLQRETLEIRRAGVEHALDAALAAVELQAAAGVLR